MSYTLEQLSADCRTALDAGRGESALEQVVAHIRKACVDPGFVADHLSGDGHVERRVLYEDDKHGFCILAHVYEGAKSSTPHDHGSSWAIYGQVAGETIMSDFNKVAEPAAGAPGKAERTRSYTLRPGDAHLYKVGDLHAPERRSSTRLLRVEGMNMANVKRDSYVVV